jgi:hypothetical protein
MSNCRDLLFNEMGSMTGGRCCACVSPFKLYLVKLGKVCQELGHEGGMVFPNIYKQTTKFAQKLEAI